MTALVLAQTEPGAVGSAEFWVFLVIGAVSLGSAISMVAMRNAVHAALMLVLNFFTIAVLYAVLEAQFLAVIQIIVYAGAIMVLFLFVIMLLGVAKSDKPRASIGGLPIAALLAGVLLFAGVATGIAGAYLGPRSVCGDPVAQGDGEPCRGLEAVNTDGNIQALGERLFSDYVWPFEVTAVLLVIAAVGAMVIGRRTERPEELTDRDIPVDEAARRQAGVDALARRSPHRTRSPGERI